MPLPVKFRKTAPFIQAFDWADIANATGYEVYYGANGLSGSYIVTNSNLIYSEHPHTTYQDNITTVFVKYVEEDFDLLFNLPQNIRGTILANIPIGVGWAGAARHFHYYAVVDFIHVDADLNETVLGTGQSDIFKAHDLTTGQHSEMALCGAEISPERHFKKGETLRFTVKVYAKVDTTSTSRCGFAHEPSNRADFAYYTWPGDVDSGQVIETGDSTRMSFHVPYRLNP